MRSEYLDPIKGGLPSKESGDGIEELRKSHKAKVLGGIWVKTNKS